MALDGAFLFGVKNELDCLVNGRIDKIYQPSRDEVILQIRTHSGAKKLLINASAGSARVHITETAADNPLKPPMFCMLLRKHLGGGRLREIRQDGLERILFFDFECMNELGDFVIITLACEIMGKYSNLIVIDNTGKIIDSIRRVDEDMSRERLVLPGMPYELPPRDGRLSFVHAEEKAVREELDALPDKELSKALISAFEGISPILAREWTYRCGKGRELRGSSLTVLEKGELFSAIMKSKDMLLSGKCEFTTISTAEGQLKDFSFTDIQQYGSLMLKSIHKTACETLDNFFEQRDRTARLKQRANDLFKTLSNLSERITKRIANQKNELADCGKKDVMKLYGDLLSANMYRFSKGDSSVTVENFYEEDCPQVKIKLDPRLTPPQNSQKYYSEYRKAVTAEKKLAEQIKIGEGELVYIESVFESLERAVTENEVNELRLELAEQGYIKASRLKSRPPKSAPPLEYLSSDGFRIFVGRNNKQNDKLTLKIAAKSDIWLHTQNIPGSHVIIEAMGGEVPMSTIEEAAVIAAFNSKARASSGVPVDYCPVKFVKKPGGAKPGMVIFTNNRTLYVTPDKELEMRLKK